MVRLGTEVRSSLKVSGTALSQEPMVLFWHLVPLSTNPTVVQKIGWASSLTPAAIHAASVGTTAGASGEGGCGQVEKSQEIVSWSAAVREVR